MARLSDLVEDCKTTIRTMERKHKFKKANKQIKMTADLQYDLGVCRGKLKKSQDEFEFTIRAQSHHIAKGQANGLDTTLQEQTLWDAAIGYLLVRDAMFALESLTSYDSVAHAYDMLDTATKQMSGKFGALTRYLKMDPSGRQRNIYGYVTSTAALKQKEEFLNTFFEELKVCGDIEACLAAGSKPSDINVDRRRMGTSPRARTVQRGQGLTGSARANAVLGRLDGLDAEDEEVYTLPDNTDALPQTNRK